MRVTSFDLSYGKELGLSPGRMTRLGNLVVLAGPNGGGKSRILRALKEAVELWAPDNFVASYRTSFEQNRKAVDSGNGPMWPDATLEPWRKQVRANECLSYEGPRREVNIVDFFPKRAELADYRNYSELSLEQSETELRNGWILEGLETKALSYAVRIVRRVFGATHPRTVIAATDRAAAEEEFESLKAIVHDLLGAELSWDADQHVTLDRRRVADGELSQGQAILLQMAVVLHAKRGRLGELILLVDEPERHLHPAACREMLDRVLKANGSGQIWIATHSIPVLASVPPDSVWFVRDGAAAWAGRKSELVLEGLLGKPEDRAKIGEFLQLPLAYASQRFAAESLLPPNVVDTAEGDDPQTEQVSRALGLQTRTTASDPLRVLDFGAGAGRVLGALAESLVEGHKVEEVVSYLAFEPHGDVETLEQVVGTHFSDVKNRVFRSNPALRSLGEKSVDVVLMCNVLHELTPQQWIEYLGAEGYLPKILKDDGKLLILEDEEIPVGERAHEFGFLLLPEAHLRLMLGARATEGEKLKTFSSLKDRLKAHVIPRELLGRVDWATATTALEELSKTALEKVRSIRENSDPSDSKAGRRHGLWTQLHVNSRLALSTLGQP